MVARSGVFEVIVDASTLEERVRRLASSIEAGRSGAETPLVAVGILKGSTLFLADLLRRMHGDVRVDFMSISPYASAPDHPGKVRILKDLDTDVAGKDLLIVEDIVDTGLTLSYLRKTLGSRGPRSVSTVALLDKRVRRIVPVPVEYVGFEIADVFVVGYGLDFQGRYRNLRQLLEVRDVARLAADPLLPAGSFLDDNLRRGVSFGP